MNSRARNWVLVVAVMALGGCAASQPYVVTQQSTRISESEIHARIKAANPGYSGTGKIMKGSDGVIWGLDLRKSNIVTLEPLRGMQLTAVSCPKNAIEDLSPLKGMKLLQLILDDNPVSDLSPLSGMPLWKLAIKMTKVTDLGPLAGMQLQELSFSPENIANGIEVVRDMKSITYFPIATHPSNPTIGLGCSVTNVKAEAFWNLYENSRCPDGTIVEGGRCTLGCPGGEVLSNGRCCWPGQVWEASKAACDGGATCPEGTVWDGKKCARYTIVDNDLARDNKTGLVWLRESYFPGSPPGQTQAQAAEFCKGKGMRLPTKEESLEIAGSSCDATVFGDWSTWTSTSIRAGMMAIVANSGASAGLGVGLVGLGASATLCVR